MHGVIAVQARTLARSRIAAAVLFFSLVLIPLAVRAEGDGAGTEWLKCRDSALIELGVCYLNANGYWDKVRCNLAWEGDRWGCNAEFAEALSPIF